MAQFVAFEKGVEVNGQTILALIEALEVGKDFRREILAKHGIIPERHEWYDQQAWLDAFREISDTIGDRTLFMIGKAIPEHADFPPVIDTLEKALASIDIAYHMNHRKGEIGSYILKSFNEDDKVAIMICNNPYPSEFDRGIITTMLRRFKPKNSYKYDVILDTEQETRLNGGESCTYKVIW